MAIDPQLQNMKDRLSALLSGRLKIGEITENGCVSDRSGAEAEQCEAQITRFEKFRRYFNR
jgi:hypothetical protein